MRPVIQPCSDSSCIRFSVRRKVDLPQPEGPMRAWTRLEGKPIETPFTAANLPYIAVSLSVTRRGRASVLAAGGAGTGSFRSSVTALTAGSAIDSESAADGEPGAEAQDEHHENQHQRRGPGIAVPLRIGPSRIREHG